MCAAENKSEILSRIITDLFAKSQGVWDLSAKIVQLRNEIKKVVYGEDTIFGQFHALVESFREIISDENQRYSAALKALSTTSKLSRQDIVKAVGNQLAELKVLEKVLLSTSSGWNDELRAREARSREIRDELARLRDRIGQLEREEQDIRTGMASREQTAAFASKAVTDLFKDLLADISNFNNKLSESGADIAPPQPVMPPIPQKSEVPAPAAAVIEQKTETPQPAAPQYSEFQKKCPMCGGTMVYYSNDKRWQCFSCAYEQLEEGQKGQELRSEEPTREEPASEDSDPVAPQSAESHKKCPMCGGRMDYYINGNKWICFSCAYEESAGDGPQAENNEEVKHVRAPEFTEVAESVFAPSKKTAHSHQTTKKKPCPLCHKKMNWHPEVRSWRCPYCHYGKKG